MVLSEETQSTTPMGVINNCCKEGFPRKLSTSRLDGLFSQNIKFGLKATGLWPVAPSKTLLIPLLLEKSIKRTQEKTQRTPGELKRAEFTPQKVLDMQRTIWPTPQKSRDLRVQMNLFNIYNLTNQTSRNLFREVTKDFDE